MLFAALRSLLLATKLDAWLAVMLAAKLAMLRTACLVELLSKLLGVMKIILLLADVFLALLLAFFLLGSWLAEPLAP